MKGIEHMNASHGYVDDHVILSTKVQLWKLRRANDSPIFGLSLNTISFKFGSIWDNMKSTKFLFDLKRFHHSL